MKSVYTGGEKVAEFESYDELRVGRNKPAFIYEGNEMVYPNPVKDGLVLWYDFSGRTNTDGQRGIAEDLSGNGNHGTLQNFNYTIESGYDKNKLLFDGVDDQLQIPETGLNPESMAVVDNGKIYSYEGDTVTSVDKDGSVYTGGENILLDSEGLITSDEYNIQNLNTVKKIPHGTPMTLTIKAKLGSDRTSFNFFNNKGITNYRLARVDKKSEGFFIYSVDFDWIEDTEDRLRIYQMPHDGTSETSIEWAKIEKRNSNTLYSPASLDYLKNAVKTNYMQNLLFYNRPLTAEEIAHNYAIEKERFGIE